MPQYGVLDFNRWNKSLALLCAIISTIKIGVCASKELETLDEDCSTYIVKKKFVNHSFQFIYVSAKVVEQLCKSTPYANDM